MGIRFHCPNGHPLHVKAFLAGKRGICPVCDTKLIIPVTSEDLPHPLPEDSELRGPAALEPGDAGDQPSSAAPEVQQFHETRAAPQVPSHEDLAESWTARTGISPVLGQHACARRRRRDRARVLTLALSGMVIFLLVAVILVVMR